MSENANVSIYLRSHNEVDQISPIIYKIGDRNNVTADVHLLHDVSYTDYRINKLKGFDNISIHNHDSSDSYRDHVVSVIKEVGRNVPTDFPKKVYDKFFARKELPNRTSSQEKQSKVVAFDWGTGRSKKSREFSEDPHTTTIVLPHGDRPYLNRVDKESKYDKFINDWLHSDEKISIHDYSHSERHYRMAKHDFFLFSSELSAQSIRGPVDDNCIHVLGSPRYNKEWLNILSNIAPNYTSKRSESNKFVFFVRREGYFINKKEVTNTIKMLSGFENSQIVIKEHPRKPLYAGSKFGDLDNVTIVGNGVESASLTQWGDIFLSLGTTITYDPIMRKKPVFCIDYATSNKFMLSEYFPESIIETKEEMFDNLCSVYDDPSNFYNEEGYSRFVNDKIKPSERSVLDSWAEFIEGQCEV